jgi:hypothetical protein
MLQGRHIQYGMSRKPLQRQDQRKQISDELRNLMTWR